MDSPSISLSVSSILTDTHTHTRGSNRCRCALCRYQLAGTPATLWHARTHHMGTCNQLNVCHIAVPGNEFFVARNNCRLGTGMVSCDGADARDVWDALQVWDIAWHTMYYYDWRLMSVLQFGLDVCSRAVVGYTLYRVPRLVIHHVLWRHVYSNNNAGKHCIR